MAKAMHLSLCFIIGFLFLVLVVEAYDPVEFARCDWKDTVVPTAQGCHECDSKCINANSFLVSHTVCDDRYFEGFVYCICCKGRI
ncbi:hypothetical protein C5167_041296 [Papaver somniferum]|uniref:Knottin scorpion toxin-like domain-containing protein n=1 Tax=Papaver somniferum TaxID=3469 RepID=A0A4Y7IHH3_PAPSO|nr:hypothetical protein C5167_041296 [Papaver somniferum]